jgi:hypothetical protein
MTTAVARREASPQSRHPSRGRIANRLVGVGFAAAAIGNAVSTLHRSTWFVEWMADSAWIPPYPWFLQRLVGVAPVVVGATVVFEAALAVMLITRWHERVALGLATLWVLGVIPAIAWPYWLVNVPMAIVFGILWWRCRMQNDSSITSA